MNWKEFIAQKGITELDKKSAEELAVLHSEYIEEGRKELMKAIEAKADAQIIQDIKSNMDESVAKMSKNVFDAMKEMELRLAKQNKGNGEVVEKSIESQLLAAKDKLADLKAKKSGSGLSIKAPATMLRANITGRAVPEQYLSGIDSLLDRRVRLLDIVSRGVATTDVIKWVSEASRDGAPGQTAEGALKAQIDFDLVVTSEVLKKTTAWIKVSDEMIEDVPFIMSEINNHLQTRLLLAVEDQVYSGDGTGENHRGIKTIATAFSAGARANQVDNANEADVLARAIEQIEVINQEMPNYILCHPFDINTLKFIKNSTTDRRYVDRLQIIAGDLSLDGLPIIKSTLVPQGEYLVGAFNLANVYSKGGIDLEMDREMDDFTKNLVTIRAEWRGLTLVRNNHRSAFVKGVFATDKTALETP